MRCSTRYGMQTTVWLLSVVYFLGCASAPAIEKQESIATTVDSDRHEDGFHRAIANPQTAAEYAAQVLDAFCAPNLAALEKLLPLHGELAPGFGPARAEEISRDWREEIDYNAKHNRCPEAVATVVCIEDRKTISTRNLPIDLGDSVEVAERITVVLQQLDGHWLVLKVNGLMLHPKLGWVAVKPGISGGATGSPEVLQDLIAHKKKRQECVSVREPLKPALRQSRLRFTDIEAGYNNTCGVKVDGGAVCWGAKAKQFSPPKVRLQQISCGPAHCCGVGTNQRVTCWGDLSGSTSKPPDRSYSQVSVGVKFTCGIRQDGDIDCWGSALRYGDMESPKGTFTQFAAGGNHACGIRTDGTAFCWGSNKDKEAWAPVGVFTDISAGVNHSCGIREDGSVLCWGSNRYGQTTPPQGKFSQVAAGGRHSCAIGTDGQALCWGYDGKGQYQMFSSKPPKGIFTQISAGYDHTCGMMKEGRVVCWGDDQDGKLNLPKD